MIEVLILNFKAQLIVYSEHLHHFQINSNLNLQHLDVCILKLKAINIHICWTLSIYVFLRLSLHVGQPYD